jgi:hypothetical protein
VLYATCSRIPGESPCPEMENERVEGEKVVVAGNMNLTYLVGARALGGRILVVFNEHVRILT